MSASLGVGADLDQLVTPRLMLRPMAMSDDLAMLAILSQADVCTYLLHEPLELAAVRERLARTDGRRRLAADHDLLRLAVRGPERAGLIGELVLMMDSVANRTVEVGWVFSPDHQGRGYATEAARALLGWAFDTLGAHRAIARLHPDNGASARVCERLGMRLEAHHRLDLWVKGGWEDTVIYAVLAEEWATAAAG